MAERRSSVFWGCSSEVERAPVKRMVVGSIPTFPFYETQSKENFCLV